MRRNIHCRVRQQCVAGIIEQTWRLFPLLTGLRDNHALFIYIPARINPSTLSSAMAAIQLHGLP